MFKKVLIVFLVSLIAACGGGGGGSTPTNPDTVFQVFPSAMFVPGTIKTTNYTGTDNNGGTYTGVLSEQTQTESVFLGQAAIPVLSQLQFTNTGTGASVTGISTTYFSTSVTDRRFLGTSDSTTTTVTANTTPIPQTVKIGDFGNIGTYTDNAGNVTTVTFRIDDGGNGNGKAVVIQTERDQFGALVSTETTESIIDPSGNTLSETIIIFFNDLGVTVTLNGS